MKSLIYKIPALLLFWAAALQASAQSGMEEYFYASGKIKVVVAVVTVVISGILLYIISLERRIKKIENKK